MTDSPTGRLHANEPALQNVPVRADTRALLCLFCGQETGSPFPTEGKVACLDCVHRIVDFWALGFLHAPHVAEGSDPNRLANWMIPAQRDSL